MAILEVQHVSKSFGNTEVLKDIRVPEFSGAARRRCDPCKRGDAF